MQYFLKFNKNIANSTFSLHFPYSWYSSIRTNNERKTEAVHSLYVEPEFSVKEPIAERIDEISEEINKGVFDFIMVKRALSVLTIILVLFIMNFICFFYYNPLHGSDLNPYRLEPGTIGIYAVEGYGILYADKNGFSNIDDPLIEEDYILVMGSSQSKGDQMFVNERYSSVLNRYLGYSEELGVYNLAYSGGQFYDIVKNFEALITEFPNSRAVIIEVADAQIAIDENSYLDAMNQVKIEESVIGEKLNEHHGIGKVRYFVKKYCPLLLLYVNQYMQWRNSQQVTEQILQDNAESLEMKHQWYTDMLELISKQYDKEIIVVYHNGFSLNEDNTMDTTLSKTGNAFIEACDKNGISVLNMTQVFSDHYDAYRQIPYGFWNTSMGEGHLNRVGHELIAKQLYEYLEGKQK